MRYVVLLRGINVGGKNRVPMSQLKLVLEDLGCEDVRTYINSGNVVLSDPRKGVELHGAIEDALRREFGFDIRALVLEKPAFERVVAAIPPDWRNDDTMRCDVMFLWNDINLPVTLDALPARPGIDSVLYVDGAIVWSVARGDARKSGLPKLIGTELYKKMTIRNCTTVRALSVLLATRE